MVEKSPSANEPSWSGIAIAAIVACFMLYLSAPNIALIFGKRTSKIKINDLNEEHLTYEYKNELDGNTYLFSRKLINQDFDRISKTKDLSVAYSPYFPEDVIIENIDKEKPIVIPVIMNALLITGIIIGAVNLKKQKKKHNPR